jgi:TRAP-type C4-dicarboxylate transport system substrate-binding protein
MARNYSKVFLSAACAIALFSCILATPAFSAESVIRLKYSNFLPPPHGHSVLIDQWGKELEKRTNGRVKVSHFPGSTLTPANQTYDAIVKGITDIGLSILSYTPGRMPLSEVLTLPLGVRSGYQAAHMANAYYDKFKPKELDDVKVFFLMGPGPFIWHSKTLVTKIEDLKGIRFKSDANTSKIVAAAGATPTTMPMSETYDAMKRGLAEGVLNPIETLKGWKFADVATFTWENYGGSNTNSFFVAMNKEKWNSLPKDIQQIMEKLNEEWFEKHSKMWNEIDDEAREWSVKKGHKFTKATPEDEAKMRERMKPVLDKYVSDMRAKGLPGDEVLKFCLDFVKTAPVK